MSALVRIRVYLFRFLLLILMFNLSLAQPLVEDVDMNDMFGDEFATSNKVDYLNYYNVFMTDVNIAVLDYLVIPTAKVYAYITPRFARKGIYNFFDNLGSPSRFINNILQLKFKNSLHEASRFTLNSTIGILGLIDIASMVDLKKYDEDFGQTLGYYGVGSGFHIVLPIWGPSNVRDAIGRIGNWYIDPLSSNRGLYAKISKNSGESIVLEYINIVNKFSLDFRSYNNMIKDALDLYPFLKNIYEQSREKAIKE